MRLLGYAFVAAFLIVVIYLVADYLRSNRHDVPKVELDVAADVLHRCRETRANLAYIASLPEPGSPLQRPIAELVDELVPRVDYVERAIQELVQLHISGALREREEARLDATLRATEQAAAELHPLAVRGSHDIDAEQVRARDKIKALRSALDELYGADAPEALPEDVDGDDDPDDARGAAPGA